MQKEAILERYPRCRESLLGILHDLQRSNPGNYLTVEDMRLVAEYLDLPLSAVYDAVTFYSMFSLKPRGKHIIRVCDSPTCHIIGSCSVLRELGKLLGIGIGETTPDGLFTLELSSCLGLCDIAPAMMIDDEPYGHLTPARLREIIRSYKEGR